MEKFVRKQRYVKLNQKLKIRRIILQDGRPQEYLRTRKMGMAFSETQRWHSFQATERWAKYARNSKMPKPSERLKDE
jgi:hypothetical protein